MTPSDFGKGTVKRMLPTPKADPQQSLSAAAPLPAFSSDGVDLTLIRWMLSLTPAERPAVLRANVRSIVRMREMGLQGTMQESTR